MDKQSIIHSLKQLADEGEVEILSQTQKRITIWDSAGYGKELTFYFKEYFTYGSISRRVYVSPYIPKPYKSTFNKKLIVDALLNKIDTNCLLTMKALFIIYDDRDRERLMALTNDEYALEIGMDLVGVTWWERNICIVNANEIIAVAKEVHGDDKHYLQQEVEIGLGTTIIHELRHLLLDTNILLPEDEYPIELASEEMVEEYCRNFYENHF